MIPNNFTGYALRKVKSETYSFVFMKNGNIDFEITIFSGVLKNKAIDLAYEFLECMDVNDNVKIEYEDLTSEEDDENENEYEYDDYGVFTGFIITNDEENDGYILLEYVRDQVVDITTISAKNNKEALNKAKKILGADVDIEFQENIDYQIDDDMYLDDEDFEDYEENDDEYDLDEEEDYDDYLTEDEESFIEYCMDPSHQRDD